MDVHPRNLTWNLKIMVSKWTFLFQGLIFRFHVKFRGCILFISLMPGWKPHYEKPPQGSTSKSSSSIPENRPSRQKPEFDPSIQQPGRRKEISYSTWAKGFKFFGTSCFLVHHFRTENYIGKHQP